VIRDS